jgi:hypothetical protein
MNKPTQRGEMGVGERAGVARRDALSLRRLATVVPVSFAMTVGLGFGVMLAGMVSCSREAVIIAPPPAPPARSRSQAVLRTAWASWRQAADAVNDERAALEEWDPAVGSPDGEEVLRRQLMSRDSHGHLARARRLAQQASALAETRTQEYEAILLLVRIASDADQPREELRFARRLMALDPGQPRAQAALQAALKHESARQKAVAKSR